VLLVVYANSVRRRRTGAPLTWKGRTYLPRELGVRQGSPC
jgi:hypothetical protein